MKKIVLNLIIAGLCLISNAQNIQNLNDFPKYITPEMVKMMRENGTYEKQRKELRKSCDLSIHDEPGRQWQKEIVTCKYLFCFDKEFYDQDKMKIRVEEIAQEGKDWYGGYDEILLWPTYPRLGIDERNQFDFYRQLPGGMEGVKKMIEEFHKHGIRITFGYNPWDIGTRREGRDDAEVMAELFKELGVDGIFLDTMTEGDSAFVNTLLSANPNLRFFPEAPGNNSNIELHTSSWRQNLNPNLVLTQQWIHSDFSPLINELPKSYEIVRESVELALLQGNSYKIKTSNYGSDFMHTDREKAMIKDMVYIRKTFNDFYRSNDWDPFIETKNEHLMAHQWRHEKDVMFTLYNNADKDYKGDFFNAEFKGEKDFIDIWNNKKVEVRKENGKYIISGEIKAGEVAVIVPATFVKDNWETSFRKIPQRDRITIPLELKEVERTVLMDADKIPSDMVLVKGGDYLRSVRHNNFGNLQGRCYGDIEGQTLAHMGLNFTTITPFAMDKNEVTNAQYLEFLISSKYVPRDTTNFLAHWIKPNANPATWNIPAGYENHPVVYVDIDDARAYAKWAKKRLPTEPEWQYAAEGPNNSDWPWKEKVSNDPLKARDANNYRWGLIGRKWPWGDIYYDEYCNCSNEGTTPVGSFPNGASIWGVNDLVGNVWEWTESEYEDGQGRFAIIRGGSYFVAEGSYWYTASGPQPNHTHEKFPLTYPGLDRCSTIGFRCVSDVISVQDTKKEDISKEFSLE